MTVSNPPPGGKVVPFLARPADASRDGHEPVDGVDPPEDLAGNRSGPSVQDDGGEDDDEEPRAECGTAPGDERNRTEGAAPPYWIRGQHQRRADPGVLYFNKFLSALMATVPGIKYPLIECSEDAPISLLDIDVHDWDPSPEPAVLAAWVADVHPAPHCWWTTHGAGVRLVYHGTNREAAEEAAIAAAMSWPPKGCTLEILRATRHPAGEHPKYPGVKGGEVVMSDLAEPYGAGTAWSALAGLSDGPSEEDRSTWLEARGMEVDGRYGHEHCPIHPQERRDDLPVAVYGWGLKCYACEGHGRSFPGASKTGTATFSLLIGGRSISPVMMMAKAWVHWTHARLVLRHFYGEIGLSDTILQAAYRLACASGMWGDRDPRLKLVFSPDLEVLRSDDHRWLNTRDLGSTKLTKDTYRSLPWCLDAVWKESPWGGRKLVAVASGPRLDSAANSHALEGYTPLRPIQGALLRPDAIPPGTIPVLVPRSAGKRSVQAPCRDPMPWSEAFSLLEETFPKISEVNVRGLLFAAICAEPGRDRFPILLIYGPSGSGKGATVNVVNGILGGQAGFDIQLDNATEPFMRELGTLLSRGVRFLRIPELARIQKLYSHLGKLLSLSETLTWRPLYESITNTPFRAALVLNCLAPPQELVAAPEMCRRIRSLCLPTRVPEWAGRCPLGLPGWRDLSADHALAADSLITHALTEARQHGFEWEVLADAAGLQRLADEEGGMDTRALADLYEHVCGRLGQRKLSTCSRFPADKGWIDLTSDDARAIIDLLLSDHPQTSEGLRLARFRLGRDLEAADWPSILSLPDDIYVRCEARPHGRNFVGRFIEGGRRRGDERRNSELPASSHGGRKPESAETSRARTGCSDSQCPVLTSQESPPVLGSARYDSISREALPTRGEGPFSQGKGDSTPSPPLSSRNPVTTGITQRRRGKKAVTTAVTTGHNRHNGLANVGFDRLLADILAAAGFPAETVALDFESYFDAKYSLRRMSVAEYVNDPRFLVHGVALRRGGSTTFEANAERALANLTDEQGVGWPGVTVVMHNAAFDAYILDRIYGIRPDHIVCTMAMATAVLGRGNASLKVVADRFGLKPKGELNTEGLRELPPAQMLELAGYAKHDADLTHEILPRLLSLLPRPEVELRLIEHTVRMGIERTLVLDREGIEAIKREVAQETRALVKAGGLTAKALRSPKQFNDALEAALAAVGEELPGKQGKKGLIPATAKTDPFMQKAIDHVDPEVRALARARLAVTSSSQTRSRINTLLRLDAAHGGIPMVLAYYAAHTARWGGSGLGINLQNLPSRGDDPATRIREMLGARPGHLLVVVDLAQIEARILAWQAGQRDLLAGFADGIDTYSLFASGVFNESVHKPLDSDPPDVAKRMKALRHVGKTAVLGLGYRMGAYRFWKQLQAAPELADLVASGELSPRRAVQVVREYRRRYSSIAATWRALEEAALYVVDAGGSCDVGKLSFRRGEDGDLLLDLPSGRWLRYRNPRIVEEEREITTFDDDGHPHKITIAGPQIVAGTPGESNFHGGIFTENAVQAIARDILGEAVLRIEDAGIPVLLHVHDEVVVDALKADAKAVEERVIEEMMRPPAWAPDLPLDAEGWFGPRYGKH